MPIDKLSGNSFATGAISNSLGYTPANKAGDTFTGAVIINDGVSTGLTIRADNNLPSNTSFPYIRTGGGGSLQINSSNASGAFGKLFLNPDKNSDVILATGGGNVGINTASPTARLSIVSNSSIQGIKVTSSNDWGNISTPFVDIDGNANGGGDGNILRVKTGAARSDAEIFEVVNGNGTQFLVRGDGNVGVGNSSPISRLHVTAAGANGIVLGTDSNDSTASTRLFGQTASSNGGIFWYENSGNPMWCFTTGSTVGSSTGSTRLTISQYGLALANYDAATSGTGIKFPASQNASSDANTLDDYEEGTYTPTVVVSSGTPAYQYQQASYTKIGRQVFGGGLIGITNSSSLGGAVRVSLPFSIAAPSYGYAGGWVADGQGWNFPITANASGNVYSVTWMCNSGQSHLTFTCVSTTPTEIPYTASGISNTWYVRFGFSYYTT